MKKEAIFLFAILILAFMYFYHYIDIPFVRMDEGWLLEAPRNLAEHFRLASPMVENGRNQTSQWHLHPPFHYVCLAIFFKIFGFSLVKARLFSTMMAVVCALVFLSILRKCGMDRLLNKAFTLMLIFTTPLFYVAAKTVRPEITFLLLSLLSFYFLICWNDEKKTSYLILGSVSTAFLGLTHYYVLHMIIPWGYVLIKNRNMKSMVMFLTTGMLVFLPYIFWVMSDFESFRQQVLVSHIAPMFNFKENVFTIFRNIFLSHKTITISLVLIVGNIALIFRIKRFPDIIPRLLLVIPYIFFLQFLIMPRFSVLYMLAIMPFAYLSFYWLMKNDGKKMFTVFLTSVLIINTSGILYIMYKYRNYNYELYRKQFTESIPLAGETKIFGRASTYPIFSDTKFRAIEAFELIHRDRNEMLIDVINDSDYVIVDEFTKGAVDKNIIGTNVFFDDEVMAYVESHMKLASSFVSKSYGSEGLKSDNLISIYAK